MHRDERLAIIQYTYKGKLRSARVMIVIVDTIPSYWLSFPGRSTGRFFKMNDDWIWEGPIKPEGLKQVLTAAIEHYIIQGNKLPRIDYR